MTTSIFTDAIKDCIGNEIVVDQFDTYYEASFYGTMKDDFVTGSMLTSTQTADGRSKYTTGSRGSAFSVQTSDAQPPLGTSSQELLISPFVSFRSQPWSEQCSSTAVRFTQFFDEKERYYDSCIPSLNTILGAAGASAFFVSGTSRLPEVAEATRRTFLSPYGNTEKDVGYVVFNSPDTTDARSGKVVSDNEWTWSYPFQSKYNPFTRLLSPEAAMKVSVDKIGYLYPRPLEAFSDIRSRADYNFMILLPGRLTNSDTGRTSAFLPTGSSTSDKYGSSILVAADVNLSQQEDHSFLPAGITAPSPEYVTSSMTVENAVRCVFGFGDLNNVAFSYRRAALFQDSLTGSTTYYFTSSARADQFTSTKSLTGSISWGFSEAVSPSYESSWTTTIKTKTETLIISGSPVELNSAVLPTSTAKVFWPVDEGTYILKSPSTGNTGSMIIDVTSSNPWALAYNRAVIAPSDINLSVWLTGEDNFTAGRLTRTLLDQTYGTGVGTAKEFFVSPVTSSAVPPGVYRLTFDLTTGSASSLLSSGAYVSSLRILKWDAINGDPNSIYSGADTRIGYTAYPTFRTTINDDRSNLTYQGTTDQVTATAARSKSIVYGISPVIRGWKYGLISGLPLKTKAVFRRDRFGQFRDMLEQRPFAKTVGETYVSSPAVPPTRPTTKDEDVVQSKTSDASQQGDGPVDVTFVTRKYTLTDPARRIGRIYNEQVSPFRTVSCNMSTEVTSSIPYFDGVARERPEEAYRTYVKNKFSL